MSAYIQALRADPKWITILVALTIGYNAYQMVPISNEENYPDYYEFVLFYSSHCSLTDLHLDNGALHRAPLKYYFHCVGYKLFDNTRVIPIIFNIGIMPLVYILARKITNDNLIAFVSLVAFTLNPIWIAWRDSATYDQSWAFFLLLSVILSFKSRTSLISTFVFLISIACKSVSVLYVPLWAYMVIKADYTPRYKIIALGLMGLIMGIGAYYVVPHMTEFVGNQVYFRPERLEDALVGNLGALWEITPFMLGVVGINTMFRPKKMPHGRKTVGLWMVGILMMTPAVYLFTDHMEYTYRFIPFVGFLSILVGLTASQLLGWIQEVIIARPIKIH